MEQDLMVYRCENKYLIDSFTALAIKRKLDMVLPSDKYSSVDGYMVRSLYFDTPNQNDVFDKLDGLECGHKIRIRIYNHEDKICKLELKSKCGIARKKYSVIITRTEADEIISGEYSCLVKKGTKAALRIYTIMMMGAYRPVAIIEYMRSAWVFPCNNTRITIDTKVKGGEYYFNLFEKEPPYSYYNMDTIILEIKFNGQLPYFISKMLEEFDLEQISISKYTTARTVIQHFLEGA